MALQTTVVGSMAHPDYVQIKHYITNGHEVADFVQRYNECMDNFSQTELKANIRRATKEAIIVQQDLGIDVISDGEMGREWYAYEFCRMLKGFDFREQVMKVCRDGAWEGLLPKITGKICFGDNYVSVAEDWRQSQEMAKHPVKYTLPGPMTIVDTMVNEYYKDEKDLYKDLVYVINSEVKALASAGCKHIQIDEPVMVRIPKVALEIGIENLTKCFEGVPQGVSTIVHCCCGYPQYLDQKDYRKADLDAYLKVAERLDDAGFEALSIEDAHRRNGPELFSMFKKKKIILGVIDVVTSRVEAVEEIQQHIQDVLKHIPRERLMIAPDCGLIFLTRELMSQKLKNMVKAAQSV